MTVKDWIMSAFGVLTALFCLFMSHSFSKERMISPRNSKRCRGKIKNVDNEAFTVEYTYNGETYTYDVLKKKYIDNFGYETLNNISESEAKALIKEERMFKALKRIGYTDEFYFSLREGVKMIVWIEKGKPYHVLRVRNDTDLANKSSGRAFRTIGFFILSAIAIIIISKLGFSIRLP